MGHFCSELLANRRFLGSMKIVVVELKEESIIYSGRLPNYLSK